MSHLTQNTGNQMNQVLPFIDVTRLVAAMEPHCEDLTQKERARNSHGAVKVYNRVFNEPSGSTTMSTSVASQVNESPDEGTNSVEKQLKRRLPVPTEITLQPHNSGLPLQSPKVPSLQVLELDSHFLNFIYVAFFV